MEGTGKKKKFECQVCGRMNDPEENKCPDCGVSYYERSEAKF